MDVENDEGREVVEQLVNHKRKIVAIVGALVAYTEFTPYIPKVPCHTSKQSSYAWMREVISGHRVRFIRSFRMEKGVFKSLCRDLEGRYDLSPTRDVGVQEMVAMFLWTLGQGNGNRRVQERFQHSGETVSRHFHSVLDSVYALGIDIIKPLDPTFADVHTHIRNEERYWPYFKNYIGAIDGTHIHAVPPAENYISFIGRKGVPTQNVMAACDFNMLFTFVYAGWERSAHDARIFRETLNKTELHFPHPPPDDGGGTMNFLLRSTHQAAAEQAASVTKSAAGTNYTTTTLEGLIADDPIPQYYIPGEDIGENHEAAVGENAPTSKNDYVSSNNHSDVLEEEGWISIPTGELPDNWNTAPDIKSLRSLHRSFVFPGEQVHVLACLSANKQYTETITPFKVAAMMSKNGPVQIPEKQNGEVTSGGNTVFEENNASAADLVIENSSGEKVDVEKDICSSESILRMEDHRRQTKMLLQRFKSSHFFVRIAESGEPLWSKKDAANRNPDIFKTSSQISTGNRINAAIDRGSFDAKFSGGVARNSIKCYSLSSGDIVVVLPVSIGVGYLQEPVLEILQFEKFLEVNQSSEDQENYVEPNHESCGDLLKWLLPLNNTFLPPPRTLPPPPLAPSTGISGASQKLSVSSSSGSQLFSFGHFRSYSMSSLPQSMAPPPAPVKAQSSKPSFDLEDWDNYSQKSLKSQRSGTDELLSFRGVSLERERFSVCCGLEGIYIPGRRWTRKIEIIQPVEIHSFAADCNADDLICVRIKNIAPSGAPDIVVYIDAITIVFEEAAKGGPPSSLPIACIEAGNEHSLPNLALRKDEEHSFILKPAPSVWKNLKLHGERSFQVKKLHLLPTGIDESASSSTADQYAIMVSCRCNYTESRLFFRQLTSWRPRMARDVMISVTSDIPGQFSRHNGRASQIPVQVLTLQASNLTPEDLTLTVLAPASFNSPPTVGLLSSSPSSPMSPFIGTSELPGRMSSERQGASVHGLYLASHASNDSRTDDNRVGSGSFVDQGAPVSDVINHGLGCTHLWLQSRVPLGCLPSRSTASIKLELLPLTDGIITVDTLQIEVKEKGLTYIPEQSLKINATSSISMAIS